jgi:hypothetical protein
MKKTIVGLLLCFIMGLTQVVWADTTSTSTDAVTQSNSSGSNTSISGGYSAETTTTYQSGSSSNTSTTNTTNAYTGDQRVVNSSSAPSMSAMSQDLCVVGVSAGVSTFGLGVSGGTYRTDENCERIKLSKVLNDLGMKVAAVSILCQDPRVFYAMEQSGTPCPFEGKIGKEAKEKWKKYGKLRTDFEKYTDRLKIVEKANKKWEKEMKDKDEVIAKQATEISKNETEQKKLELEIEKLKKSQKNK